MKKYKIKFTDIAWNEQQNLLKKDKRLFEKITKLIEDMTRNPFSGLGKPELLKHQYSGYWSRRIDDKNRLVYKIIDDQTILITRCQGHYDKK
jgi:toxin YoeB